MNHVLCGRPPKTSLAQMQAKLLNIKYRRPSGSLQGTEGYISPETDWKLYVEDQTKLWLVSPDSVTLMYDFEKSGGYYGLFNCHDSKNVNKQIKEMLPEAVVHILSPELIKRINDAETVDVGEI